MSYSTVLVVEDDASLREALCDTLSVAGYHAVAAQDGNAALDVLHREEVSMVISDVQMPHMDGHTLLRKIKAHSASLPVLLMTAYGTIQKAVDAMRDGAADYLVKPFEADVLVSTVGRFVGPSDIAESEFVAADARSRELRGLAERVADSDATVMITGESGTGKEVLARFVHRHSPRAAQPFVAINCAAIPENMLEATLFGYEKGAFTGAYRACAGKFEQAQGGTLLLDEVSEMDLGLQAKLLRVLQEREVERLGGNKVIPLDVRVLATSNRVMREAVSEGRFREDLFYRLNVFPLHISPLRERPEDIVPLAQRLIERTAAQAGRPIPRLSASAHAKLTAHSWPGNVRELDNVIQRALILQRGEEISCDDLVFEHAARLADTALPSAPAPAQVASSSLNDDLKVHEYDRIVQVLRDTLGNRTAASERLGISPRTLRYKIARMREAGIEIPRG